MKTIIKKLRDKVDSIVIKLSKTTVLEVIFILSGLILTFSLIGYKLPYLYTFVTLVISLITVCYLAFKKNFLKKIFEKGINYPVLLWSVLLTYAVSQNYIDNIFVQTFINDNIHNFNFSVDRALLFLELFTLLSFFAVYVATNFFYTKIIRDIIEDFVGFEKKEKKLFIIMTIIISILIIIIYNNTTVFYQPVDDYGNSIPYDVVYTTDTGFLLYTDTYYYVNAHENDLRQPLFGIIALPFTVFVKAVSNTLPFVPNIYFITTAILHCMLLIFSAVTLSKLLNFDNLTKKIFLFIFFVSYPFLLFVLNIEQYIIAFFWLIMLINAYIKDKKNKDELYICSTGTLLTSGILFPLTISSKKLKDKIINLVYLFINTITTISIFGQLPKLLDAIQLLTIYTTHYTGKELYFYEKFYQFTDFVANCFYKLDTIIEINKHGNIVYQLEDSLKVNYIGVGIILLVIISFILNYKEKLCKICFSWVIFSFVMLCLVGWGTSENGLILYSLYFSWAYIILIIMLIEKLLKNKLKFKIIIYYLLIVSLIAINIPGIIELIKFGLAHYGL